MDLELEAAGAGGTRAVVSLSVDSPTADVGREDLGGGDGGASRDRSVSRRHVSLRLLGDGGGVAFEVVGRNPVVVRFPDGGGGSGSGSGGSMVFRRGEKGELRPGDALSLSLKAPAFWAVRSREGNGSAEGDVEPAVLDAVARRERRTRERKERERRAAEEAMEVTEDEDEYEHEGALGSDVEGLEIDLASIDPVREFGFLSMGHEVNSFQKGRIRAPKDWNWFLEETKSSSDDDDIEVTSGRGRSKGRSRNKKKKDGEGRDEDWTDESEDEKESLARGPILKRAKYVTRSKGPKKPHKENSKVESGKNIDDNEEDKDEEDETLGGFIVKNEDDESDEEDEEGEEEEFDDGEDDD